MNIWDPFNKKRLCQFHRYPTSIASLAFSIDGSLLAIASSYMQEQGDISHPEDAIFIRQVTDAETKPKWVSQSVHDILKKTCICGHARGKGSPFSFLVFFHEIWLWTSSNPIASMHDFVKQLLPSLWVLESSYYLQPQGQPNTEVGFVSRFLERELSDLGLFFIKAAAKPLRNSKTQETKRDFETQTEGISNFIKRTFIWQVPQMLY